MVNAHARVRMKSKQKLERVPVPISNQQLLDNREGCASQMLLVKLSLSKGVYNGC